MTRNTSEKILLLVKISTVTLLFAKGILHFTSPQPYHLLFSTGSRMICFVFGGLLVLFSFVALLQTKYLFKTKLVYSLIVPSIIIFIHTYCTYIAADYVPEQLVEHTLQISLPLIFIYCFKSQTLHLKKLNNILAVTVGLTFIGHGIFALGVHYMPEHFILMTNQCLNFETFQSGKFLFVIGILDIVLSILVFIPKIRQVAVWYLIIWGLLTSLARTYYVLGDGFTLEMLTVNLPNTIYRLPHGLIPLVIFIIITKIDRSPDSISIYRLSKTY